MTDSLEHAACTPVPLNIEDFNPTVQIPYGCSREHVHRAMHEFVEFLGFVNEQLYSRRITRLEAMLMPANFSSIVGEFMTIAIPKNAPHSLKINIITDIPISFPPGSFPTMPFNTPRRGSKLKRRAICKAGKGGIILKIPG